MSHVRFATRDEGDFIVSQATTLVEMFKENDIGPTMAMNILVAALTLILIHQAKGDIDEAVSITIDGFRQQIAAFQALKHRKN